MSGAWPAHPSDEPMRGLAIDAEGLSHHYPGVGGPGLTVLDDLALFVEEGERVAITGRSGAGKTTLLALLGGLERPQQGSLRVGGVDIASLAGDDLATYRRETVGFVFQHFGLLDSLTALENVELAMSVAGVAPRVRRARAHDLLARVGLGERADHLPRALSGGERQRVAIARAAANDPRLILADEPSGNLDDESTALVLDLLDELVRGRGCTFVIATHDRVVAARADRRLRLENGLLTT
jgi:ABC-type lipoprotein export system ATPase subunit